MANNHNHSPWRKSMLIPFWIIQLFFMLLFIALLGLALNVLVTYNNENEDFDDGQLQDISDHAVHEARNVVVPVWISICVICIILTITEIILLVRHKLKPLAFLIMNVVKTAVWTALFVLDIIAAASQEGRTTSIFGIIIDAILLLSFWIPLIYGSVIYHRFRREQGSYKAVSHPVDNSYDSQYPKPYATRGMHSDIEAVSAPSHPVYDTRARSPSFNHERDTRYETYRRTSFTPEAPAVDAFESRGLMSDGRSDIPQVYVEHHDGDSYEMDSRRAMR